MQHFKRFKTPFIPLFFTLLLFACGDGKVDNPASSKEIASFLETKPSLSQPKKVLAFYKAREFAPAWNEKETRETFYGTLKKAENEGLSFLDYHGKKIEKFLRNPNNLSTKDRTNLEVLLTDAFLKYADHLYYGKTAPNRLNEIWGIDRKEKDFPALLQKSIENQTIEKTMAGLKPQNYVYSGLKKSLLEYRKKVQNQELAIKIPQIEKAIEPGKKNEIIPFVAARLKQLHLLDEAYRSKDCVYDDNMQKAIKKFQTQNGLANDVVIGNTTIKELNLDAQKRYQQILVNLERWRWYPRDLGKHYILINIPNYKLAVVKNGDTVRTHNVIAGDVKHHTPIFSDSVQYIVINPEWNIPSSIRDNEIIPAASKNPDYLGSRNMYAVGPEGKRIAPSTINWSSGEAKNYRFVQGAGPSNSLGRLKIIYPNQYAIYLHDTPAQAIFNQNLRAESHGCVRVENVFKLAAYLLQDQKDWDLEKIKEIISSGETKKVKVTQPVAVHHFYWTAWRKNDETIFTNDIYKLDQPIYAALVD